MYLALFELLTVLGHLAEFVLLLLKSSTYVLSRGAGHFGVLILLELIYLKKAKNPQGYCPLAGRRESPSSRRFHREVMSLDGICDPKFTSSHLNNKTHHGQRKRLSYSLGVGGGGGRGQEMLLVLELQLQRAKSFC